MERWSNVDLVQVEDDGVLYRASYHVADGTIHANVAGRSVMTPVGNVPAASTVRAMLTSFILKSQRSQQGHASASMVA